MKYLTVKLFFSVLLCFFLFGGNAQDHGVSQAQDQQLRLRVKNTPPEIAQNFFALHEYLSHDLSEEALHLRSFFLWITKNIKYDQATAMAIDENPRIPTVPETLKSKKAICVGYSRLLAALCHRSDIPCKVVDGYSKRFWTSKAKLEEPDHTWNAVKVDGQWQLVDVTWAAGIAQSPADFPFRDMDDYYLPSPERLLKDHLPADPMWQLMDCPWGIENFRDTLEQTDSMFVAQWPCYNLADSLQQYEQLTKSAQDLKSLERAYLFNPSTSNGTHLGHSYLDRFILKAELEEQLQREENWEALLDLYPSLLALATKAQQYAELYDWQKENIAYTHINFAVTLSRQFVEVTDRTSAKSMLLEMEHHFSKAQEILAALPSSSFVQQGLASCEEYLFFTRANLADYE